MIKYKMDYIGICITVINVLLYIYNNICVHSSVHVSALVKRTDMKAVT
jgi:hypothetical protein